MLKEVAMGIDTYLYSLLPQSVQDYIESYKANNRKEKEGFNSIFDQNSSSRETWSIKAKIAKQQQD